MESDPVLNPRQVQRLLRLDCVDSVYRMIARGELKATKVLGRWRIRRSDAEALLPAPAVRDLDDETLDFIHELVRTAPALSEAQRDTIRAAFRQTSRAAG